MSRRLLALLACVCLAWPCLLWAQDSGSGVMEEVRQRIRAQTERPVQPGTVVAYDRVLHDTRSTSLFYHRRGHMPAWVGYEPLQVQIAGLLEEIATAADEGLEPVDYHLQALRDLFEAYRAGGPHEARALAEFDLLLTDAYLLFASHRLSGVVNPETYDPEWFSNRREADIADYLQTALLESRVRESLAALKPTSPDYGLLEKTLAHYRRIAAGGGWEPVADGPTLEVGDENERVPVLRARLAVTGDLAADPYPAEPRLFDRELNDAVIRFQSRHGLEPDGRVGPRTLAALNEPVTAKIDRIQVNLERWRWLPTDLGDPHIRVNAAGFYLQVIEANRPVVQMRAIVGQPYRKTPVFSSRITHLVVNPSWYVPRNIAVKDKLPVIRKDPGYLRRQGFTVLSGYGAKARVVDPDSVDWEDLSEDDFPYLLRQEPGPNNALGRVKFKFPNSYQVYLHDTPGQALFEKTRRTFSSGCIRLEQPLKLADYVLSRDSRFVDLDLGKLVEAGKETTLNLSETVPLHLQYWTAWVDEGGLVQFREDVYNRDTSVLAALRHKPDN